MLLTRIVWRTGAVAQICNLPYRRIAFGKALANPQRHGVAHPWRIANPRYSRLQICATGLDRAGRWREWEAETYKVQRLAGTACPKKREQARRTPNAGANHRGCREVRQVLDCASPLALCQRAWKGPPMRTAPQRHHTSGKSGRGLPHSKTLSRGNFRPIRFMAPMRDPEIVEAFHEPGRGQPCSSIPGRF